MRHRLSRNDAVALPARRADDGGRTLVVRTELSRRNEPDSFGDTVAQRPVADDHTRHAIRCLEKLEDPLLFREAADEESVRRFSDGPTASGLETPLGTRRTSRAPSARAASASAVEGQSTIRARRRSGRAIHGARRASSTSVPQS